MVNGPGKLPEPLPLPPVQETRRPAAAPQEKRIAKPAPIAEAAASVTLSARATELRSLAAKVQAVPEIRPNRVEEARRVINAAGNPEAINARIAEKLLTES